METFLNPQEVLKQVDLNSSMTVADFGCGSGGWALPLAAILSQGRVYALDIIKGPLSVLDRTAKMQGLLNVQTMLGNVEKGTKIPAGSCDLVLTTNLLFECENKKAVLEEAKRVLKQGGKIIFVDWKKSDKFGPRGRCVLPEDVKKLAQDLGLAVEKEFDAGIYHYGIILVK
jgi:ubiquinone/menaquinone biosynthesis C-methylase UbiE